MKKNPTIDGVSHSSRERGAAMVIALVMLLVLTLLATASARMTLLEERMTGNTQDRGVAFQSAEAGLRAGEELVQANVLPEFDVNAEGLYDEDAVPDAVWEGVDWEDDDEVLTYEDIDDAPAAYIVEELPAFPESLGYPPKIENSTYYRVTSRGEGVSGNATVTLQTTFKR